MPEYLLDWNEYTKTAITIAEEGAVLLKNDREALPINGGAKVAVFGRMQNNYYKSGTGSGGMVNVKHVVSILEGLSEDKDISLDEELIRTYKEWEEKNPVDPGMGWGKENWSQPEMPLSDDLVKAAAARNDAAILVIARTAGEDRDNTAEKGSFFLSDGEEEMLQKVCAAFPKTIVLLNVGNIIDMSFVTDTIAKALSDYPSSANFGQDEFKDFYAEDIFVGYRFFSTFAPEKVLYPFGFGLSYTEFDVKILGFEADGTEVTVKASVTNTGKLPGKKTVMLFAGAPGDRFAMPGRVLVDFKKTSELAPGEAQELVLSAGANRYCGFDDDGRLLGKTGWVLPKGTYSFYCGENVRDAEKAGAIEITEDTMLEELESAFKPVQAFDRLTIGGNYEPVPLRKVNHLDTRMDRLPKEIEQTGDRGIKLADVKNGKNTLEEFIAQLSDEDLSLIIRGEGMGSPKVTTGTAAAYGGITKELKAMGVPTLCCDDGPSGMRIDSGKKAFAIPNGTCLACSFNEELNEELFTWFGIEMVSNEVDVILGPGINIHRHPLNGRNFEYFSEDPLVSGRIASAQIKGLEKHGVTATIKHFCANNRETNRRFMDSIVSERALREIYLKGFEIAIKEGKARSVMSVYNMINGCFGTSNYELNTIIIRHVRL